MDVPKPSRRALYTTVLAQKFSPCGNYLVVGNNYGQIEVFDLTQSLSIETSGKCKLPIQSLKAHSGYIYCFLATDRFLISGGSTEIHGWLWKTLLHAKKLKPSWSIQPPCNNRFDIPETNDMVVNGNSLVIGCGDNNVYVFDLETRDLKQTFAGHTDYIHCVGLLKRTQQIVSGGEDGCVRFWDERSGAEVGQIKPNNLENARRDFHGSWISCLDVDESEDWMVCGGAPNLSVWHIRSKTATAILPTPHSTANVVKFEDDYILSGGTEPSVFKWSVNGDLRSSFPCSPESVYSLEVNKKLNRVLAIAGSSYNIDISTNFEYRSFSFFAL